MRNISITQLLIVFFFGILLFSDFSKIIKNFQLFIKKNNVYKDNKKK